MRWRESSDPAMNRLLVIGTGLIGGSFALATRDGRVFLTHRWTRLGRVRRRRSIAARPHRRGCTGSVCGDRCSRRGARRRTGCHGCVDGTARLRVESDCNGDRRRQRQRQPARRTAKKRRHAPAFRAEPPDGRLGEAGPEAANADLFRDRPVILTPQPETDPHGTRTSTRMVERDRRASGRDECGDSR